MKKIIFIPFIILSFIGCSSDLTIKQSTNNGNSSSSNNGSVQLPTESIIDISSGSVASDTPAPENASLYTISSHIPQTPTYDTNTVNYSLTGIYNSPNVSMKAFIENNAVNKNINNDNDTMRYIIKQQIDFNNTAKANNYKPITENDNINYKTVPSNIQVGTQWKNVYVINDPATQVQTAVTATCIDISNNVYFFIDDRIDRSQIDTTRLNDIKTEFEKGYLLVHEKCGSESDIDNNGKIIFLFTPISGNVLGFFYTADKYANNMTIQSGIYSNESEIMYINSSFLLKTTDFQANKRLLISTLIHEFHHMALFDVRSRQGYDAFMDYFVNEGLSTLTAYYTGYADVMRDYVLNFFAYEMDRPLVNNTQNLSYGYSYLFMRYFYYRFGDAGLQKLINSPYTDYRAIEAGSGMAFNDLYKDFLKMVLVTGRNVTTDARYNVDEFNHKEGTAEYEKSYISLAEMMDIFITTPPFDETFTTTYGYDAKNVPPYTFQYKKWLTMPETIKLQGTYTNTFYTLF